MTYSKSDEVREAALSCLGAFALLLISPFVAALAAIYMGVVAQKFWVWFILPTVGFALPITFFIGVAYLVKLAFSSPSPKNDDPAWKIFARGIGFAFIWPTLLLATGYLVRWWTA